MTPLGVTAVGKWIFVGLAFGEPTPLHLAIAENLDAASGRSLPWDWATAAWIVDDRAGVRVYGVTMLPVDGRGVLILEHGYDHLVDGAARAFPGSLPPRPVDPVDLAYLRLAAHSK